MKTNNKHIVLEAENLSIGYASKKKTTLISEGVTFSIKQGELVSLVGTNGIGKSTLLRTLAGMQSLLKGSISIKGKSLNDISASDLANDLSVVLTETPASQNLSVLELVSLGRHPYTNWIGSLSESDQVIINSAISATKIEELLNYKCFELSDGQLQKVLIARALTQDTPLILLDEPTTHLDIFHRASVLKLLKNLASKNKKTILFSTHEIDLAIQLSDKMMVMTKEAVFFDTPDNLIQQGCFESLFPKDVVYFDADTKRFVLK